MNFSNITFHFPSFTLLLKYAVLYICCVSSSFALYEDQVGKFDWRQQYIGKIRFAYIDPTVAGTNRFIVATDKNVLACLSTRTGSIIWRQVLEKGVDGNINALSTEGDIITVNGNGQFIRSWDAISGIMQWETSFPNIKSTGNAVLKFNINSDDKEISVVELHSQSHARVLIYSLTKSSVKSSDLISASWYEESVECKFISWNYFLCVDSSRKVLHLLPVKDAGSFMTISLEVFGIDVNSALKAINILDFPYQLMSEKPFFALRLGKQAVIFQIQPPGVKLIRILSDVYMLTSTVIDYKLLLMCISQNENVYKISVTDLGEDLGISRLDGNFKLQAQYGVPELAFVLPYLKKDQGTSYKLLLSTEDHAVLIIHQQGRLVWSREEALSEIISTEIFDLPLSETDATIEQEFGDIEASVIGMLLTRLKSQLHQLDTFFFQSLAGLQSTGNKFEGDSEVFLTRDTFGLHKVIVVATKPGKIFGLDNLSGQIIWSHFERGLSPFILQETPHMPLFVQRTTAHFPYPPQCTILGKHKGSKNTHLYSFNPITGHTLDSVILPYSIIQATPFGFPDSQYLRGIILLDEKLLVHVYPDSLTSVLHGAKDIHFIFAADASSGTVTGYSLYPSDTNKLVHANEVWRINVPQPIIHIASKRPQEHVHSQGRVMGDRSVLYKYLNPNLAAVFTEGSDPTQKIFFNVYLVDTITGLIIYSASHKRCKRPIKVVHSENWIVYSYYNEKSRRVEISSIELFEGRSQSNTTAFSSFTPPPLPLVEHQTFIFPSSVETMIDTVTERGMTNKHLLIALPTGGILELPKAYLDPRRPINPAPEHREEGLIPYIPELPVMSEGIINYNQTVMRISNIQTAPSGLESTCLVFAYGLDLFYTRVTPSKTFDILKEDFDHYLISAVLLGLLILSYTTKRLAARKSLRAAWK